MKKYRHKLKEKILDGVIKNKGIVRQIDNFHEYFSMPIESRGIICSKNLFIVPSVTYDIVHPDLIIFLAEIGKCSLTIKDLLNIEKCLLVQKGNDRKLHLSESYQLATIEKIQELPRFVKEQLKVLEHLSIPYELDSILEHI